MNNSSSESNDDFSTHALDYAANGWAVFPCWPKTKEPATRHGFKDATTNPATIRRWWLAQPNYNIAVATGAASGVWMLDPDGAIGAASLQELEAKHGPLPSTLCSITGNGCHLWFRADSPVQKSESRVGPCIDVRGDGGYAMVPPSVHEDGPIYRWANDAPIATAPAWLIELTRPRPISVRATQTMIASSKYTGSPDAYGQAALDREIAALANTAQGSRNHALNRASFSLHQLVAGGELDGAEVRARLIEAATANGLMADPADGPRSIERTIASGARAGLQHPRNRRGAL